VPRQAWRAAATASASLVRAVGSEKRAGNHYQYHVHTDVITVVEGLTTGLRAGLCDGDWSRNVPRAGEGGGAVGAVNDDPCGGASQTWGRVSHYSVSVGTHGCVGEIPSTMSTG
jgi:hypothetical protein